MAESEKKRKAKKFPKCQLDRLNGDVDFAAEIENDKIFQGLCAAENRDPALYDLETAIVIGGKITIAGREVGAPAAGTLMLLDLIESPYVCAAAGQVMVQDFFAAMYAIEHGPAAARFFVPLKRAQAEIDALRGHAAAGGAETLKTYTAWVDSYISTRARWDLAIAEYAATLGNFDLARASAELSFYLNQCGALEQLPEIKSNDNSAAAGHKKKETSTGIGVFSRLCTVLAGLTRRRSNGK